MLKIYIIATEPSGDAIGSSLISSLIKLSSKNKIECPIKIKPTLGNIKFKVHSKYSKIN